MEYFASYTGGGLSVIASDVDDLKKVIRSYNHDYPDDFKLIYDERLVQLYILNRQPFVNGGVERSFCDLILNNLPLIKDEINYIIDNDDSVSYSQSKKIRIDWVCSKIKIPEGIYLIKTLELQEDFKFPQIVSDTYYTG